MRGSPEQLALALNKYGENPNAQDSLGRTPLLCLLAPVSGEPTKEREGRLRDAVRILLSAGADLDRMNVWGKSARADLHRLTQRGWNLTDGGQAS
jgi:hypothetical protein